MKPFENRFLTTAEFAEFDRKREESRKAKETTLPPPVFAKPTTFRERQAEREKVGRQAMIAKRIKKLMLLVREKADAKLVASQILLVQETADQMLVDGRPLSTENKQSLEIAAHYVLTRVKMTRILNMTADAARFLEHQERVQIA